jgi:biopolymer transport protein ExbB
MPVAARVGFQYHRRVNFTGRRGSSSHMFEIVKAGGIVMVPLILCSILAAAITLERLWTLRSQRVVPEELVDKVWRWVENRTLSDKQILALQQHSPLGRVLAAGLANRNRDRSLMIEAIEDAGRHVAHELERYLNTLGTIAAISPLLGLLGTVTGMIRTFKAITVAGVGNPTAMASGIAEALITTAAGLIIAIPALVAYRYLRGRVDGHVIDMEKESLKLVQAIDRASVLRPASAVEIGAALSASPDAQEAVA